MLFPFILLGPSEYYLLERDKTNINKKTLSILALLFSIRIKAFNRYSKIFRFRSCWGIYWEDDTRCMRRHFLWPTRNGFQVTILNKTCSECSPVLLWYPRQHILHVHRWGGFRRWACLRRSHSHVICKRYGGGAGRGHVKCRRWREVPCGGRQTGNGRRGGCRYDTSPWIMIPANASRGIVP